MRFPAAFRWFPFSRPAVLWLVLLLAAVCLILLTRYIIGLVSLLKKIPKRAVLEKKRTYLSPLPVPQLWEQLAQKTSSDLFRSYEFIDWGDEFSKSIFLDIESFSPCRSLYTPWAFVPVKNRNWFIDCSPDETSRQTLVELTWNGSPLLFALFGRFFIHYTDQFLAQKIKAAAKPPQR